MKTVLPLGKDPPAITSLCFNHNGKILAASAADGMIHMFGILLTMLGPGILVCIAMVDICCCTYLRTQKFLFCWSDHFECNFGGLLCPLARTEALSFGEKERVSNHSTKGKCSSYAQLRRLHWHSHIEMWYSLTSERHGCWSANYWVACTWFCYKLCSFWPWWDKHF
jgi:hypothetical protein